MTPGGPDDGEEVPVDPLTAMATAAAALHEMYLAYVEVGFTEAQAMELVATALAAMINPS